MEPQSYAEWILKSSSWGGIPEIKILSEHYKIAIYVVEVP